MLFLLIIVSLVIFFLYGVYKYLLDLRYRLPPGPRPLPFIGNFHNIDPKAPFWKALKDLSIKYGPVVTFYSGQVRMVALHSPTIIRDALVTQGDTFNSRIDHKIPGCEGIRIGLINSNGDEWRRQRRFAMRAMRDFGMGKNSMVTNIHDEIVHLLPEIESYKGQPFYPRQIINNAVSNIICTLVLGKRYNYGDPTFQKILGDLERAFTYSPKTMIPFLLFPFLGYFTVSTPIRHYLTFTDTVEQAVHEAIADHRKDFNPEIIRDFPDLFLSLENKEDGLDIEKFSLMMRDMFLAGTETTSTALSWTMIYLSTYPNIQERCHEAIDKAIDTTRLPTLQDRPNLTYIDAVMCEVFRHASFVPLAVFHSNMEKTGTKIGGFDIPPMTVLIYNLAALNRDPDYWKNPEVFNPDRWISPEDGKLLNHSTHFMPFGIGPRICLGESLARVEYFIILVSLLQRFRFALKDPVDLNSEKDGVVRAPHQFEVSMHPR